MKKAFTLIELLVVIAIIAILAAILFPVFAQAKAAAKKTVSISNFKQLGLGSVMYSGDADDTFPLREQLIAAGQPNAGAPAANRQSWGPLTWREGIGPYVKSGIREVNWMTTDGTMSPRADGGLFEAPQRAGVYGVIDMHPFLGTGFAAPYDNKGLWAPISMTSVNKPAGTIMLVEKGVNPAGPWTGGDFEVRWWAWGDTTNLKGNARVTEGDNGVWPSFAMPRYRQAASTTTLSYVDGHATAKKKGAINWCQEIDLAGMGDDWLFGAGQVCSGTER